MKNEDLLKKQGFLVNDDFESLFPPSNSRGLEKRQDSMPSQCLFPPLNGKGKVVCKNQMTKDDKDDIDIDSMMIGF